MKKITSYFLLSLILSLNLSLINLNTQTAKAIPSNEDEISTEVSSDEDETSNNEGEATPETSGTSSDDESTSSQASSSSVHYIPQLNSEGEPNRCPRNEAIVSQNASGDLGCADIGDPGDDADNDGIANRNDKCPINLNADSDLDTPDSIDVDWVDSDFDGLNDGTGTGQCDAYSQTEHLQDAMQTARLNETTTALNSRTHYQDTLSAIGTCLPTQTKAHSICNSSTVNENASSDFERLNNALQNNEIIQMLNEPISNEHIFKKARVCSTKFLRDANGIVQPADRQNLYRIFNQDEISNTLETSRFIITTNKCEEFFVETCTPTPNFENSLSLQELNDTGFPVQVHCSQVQVLFANSGTDLLKVYVGLIYRWATGIIGVIAVIVIIINGILISASNGDSAKMEEAKSRITRSLVGLGLLFFSGILLYSINPTFFRPNATENATQEIHQRNTSNETTSESTDSTEAPAPAETSSE